MKLVPSIAATVAGLFAGGATVALVEGLSSLWHPLPAGLDLQDQQAVREWIADLPTSAFLLVVVAWCIGSLVGTWVARRLAPGRASWPAMAVLLALLLATLFNLLSLPGPLWMWPAGLLACLAGGCLGWLWSAPERYSVATTRQIHAPRAHVFQCLARVEHFSQAVPHILSVEFLTDSRYGVGTRFRETREMNGREATTILEVTELVENDRVRMVSEAGGTTWDTLFTVTESDGSPIPVTMHMRMEAIPRTLLAHLMVPLILGMVGKAVESDMDAVQAYCERTVPEQVPTEPS